MTKPSFEEIPVPCKKRRPGEREEQWNDAVVRNAQPGNLPANDSAPDAVTREYVPLVGRMFSSSRFTRRAERSETSILTH